jgi:tetratricopeptide (TPR) repeat protein
MTIEEAINLGLERHRAGKWREAELIYRSVLAGNPRQPDALHLLGMIAHEAGQYAAAADLIGQAIAVSPGRADFHGSMGRALEAMKKPEQAIAEYRRAIELNPKLAPAHNNLGVALASLGKSEEAVAMFERAIQIAPGYADAAYNLANTLKNLGRLAAAVGQYRRAIAARPDWVAAYNNMGVALKLNGALDEAVECFKQAVAKSPHDAAVWNNLAEALCEQLRMEDAVKACARALELQPGLPEAHNNLGYALCGLGRYDESIRSFRTALALRPEYAEAYGNLGIAYHFKADLEQAMCMFNTALALRPDFTMAKWNRGVVQLMRGEFEPGWEGFEHRPRVPDARIAPPVCDKPRWDGRELGGRRILVHHEQGLGDTLHFVRYLPMVARRGGRVVLACDRSLVNLMRIQQGVEECCDSAEERLPDFDVFVPLPSLPRIFRTRLETIPADVPYLSPEPALAARWEERVAAAARGRKRVGLVWAGKDRADMFRSTTLNELSAVGRAAGNWFCSLQKGAAALQQPPAHLELADWTGELSDFAQTAALVSRLDLVITIDTSVAHLSGALGQPTWLLLRDVPDWRWMLDRSDCPWYPTMRLFRQRRLGDWSEPIARVVEALGGP